MVENIIEGKYKDNFDHYRYYLGKIAVPVELPVTKTRVRSSVSVAEFDSLFSIDYVFSA